MLCLLQANASRRAELLQDAGPATGRGAASAAGQLRVLCITLLSILKISGVHLVPRLLQECDPVKLVLWWSAGGCYSSPDAPPALAAPASQQEQEL